MGLVMAKGVILGVITVVTFLPSLIKWVVAMLKSFFIVLRADIDGRSCGIALSML